MRATTEEFVSIVNVGCDIAFFFELVELRAVGGEVCTEVFEAVGGFLFLCSVQLVLGKRGVVVEYAGEGCEGG